MIQLPHTGDHWPQAIKDQRTRTGIDVPSAQPLELHEVLLDQVGSDAWVRFRFLASDIGKGPSDRTFADVEADFEVLCERFARPYLEEFDVSADVVAISLMSKPVEFGVADPDATQFVEVFNVTSGSCVWEGL